MFDLSGTFRTDTNISTGPSFGAIHILFGDHYLDTYLKNHDRWSLKIKHRRLTEVPHEILQNALTEFYSGAISRQTFQNGPEILYFQFFLTLINLNKVTVDTLESSRWISFRSIRSQNFRNLEKFVQVANFSNRFFFFRKRLRQRAE